ncbi:MAG: class I SAM-dependent methyltransferase [Bryobacteraceae bacterium]|nr:class I SAM-dependent methyltransferase [Solibacteraceae bacterium]MCL4841556.1 methyltransferase domain-containing protein [Bryobacteraceae bacterium]MCO5353759.1 class I SAM-dependent methyltransferase [Bryobacteraceae bacterium]HAX42109.1 SAM-dependent methyltransferase [Bryobacterales bacterium]HRJ20962.1 class I SAM-dependent methyltransferase [Bryobacteraceae bacterium]
MRLTKTLFLPLLLAMALAAPAQNTKPSRQPDVPYVPTTEPAVEEMLKLARVTKNDVVYDLGCGDGRIVIAAAKQYGARGVGIDINPERIAEANENAKKAGVTHLVKFIEQDLFEADFREASVVTLFLLTEVNLRLKPRLLEQLKPGTRVVSNTFEMGDWKPEKETKLNGEDSEYSYLSSKFFLWTIPAKASN